MLRLIERFGRSFGSWFSRCSPAAQQQPRTRFSVIFHRSSVLLNPPLLAWFIISLTDCPLSKHSFSLDMYPSALLSHSSQLIYTSPPPFHPPHPLPSQPTSHHPTTPLHHRIPTPTLLTLSTPSSFRSPHHHPPQHSAQ
ncbi:hypothetical protein K491DRAFT_259276 [Lophiostoma macrostomum CBS 122681]|uniref:Uncharacterized protein n=1 Tax=Lophiostoma macrostomum CBS 122681 TaxID=1314788 RepID=A0A6A6TEW7_9PLEO|nr:hypothetical protein K491DRAFT_259276 [Lophiostoma macrostomum CBS 122681]